MPATTTFQTAISPSDRAAAWGWWDHANQPHDEHVREFLMRDDDAVLMQLGRAFDETAYFQSPQFAEDCAIGKWR